MDAVMLLIVTVGVTECASRLPFRTMATRFLSIFPRAIRAIRRERASDHWKERALLKLARISLISSICAASAISGLVALFVGGVYLLSLFFPHLWAFAMSLEGIVIASVAAILYLAVRTHARSRLQRG
jgi:hypothetical protein